MQSMYISSKHIKEEAMKYSDNKVKDIQIAYIGGGSRGWAWTFMTDLALEDQISGTIRLYDIHGDAAKLSLIHI